MKKYSISKSKVSRKVIHNDLVKYIKAVQKRLQMKENLKFGSKAKKITFPYASREVLRNVK